MELKIFLLPLLVMALLSIKKSELLAQSITDSTNVHQFAIFLEEGKNFEMAAEEYERLSFLYPNHITFFEKAIINYRKAGKSLWIRQKLNNTTHITPKMATQYTLSLIESDDYKEAESWLDLQRNLLNHNQLHDRLTIDIHQLEGRFDKANKSFVDLDQKDQSYMQLLEEGKNIRQKSPLLAGVMSGVIPGLGRVYAKDYADGLISLLFVGTSAFQSYRRFRANGVKSVGGWIYGGLSLGFYIGNIYGTLQSVKSFNKNQRKIHNEKVKSYMDLYYSDDTLYH